MDNLEHLLRTPFKNMRQHCSSKRPANPEVKKITFGFAGFF